MSGAFHKFWGVSNNNPVNVKSGRIENVVGEPCLYENHYTEEHGFRSASSGACAECVRLIKDGKSIDLSLDRFRKNVRRRVLNFWSKVDITTWDDCWKFQNKETKKALLHFWRRPELKAGYSFHPSRIAVWLAWGDFGNGGTISKCGERRCCNPLHNLPKEYSVKYSSCTIDHALETQLDVLKKDVEAYLTNLQGLSDSLVESDPSDVAKVNNRLMEEMYLDQLLRQSNRSKTITSPLQNPIDVALRQLHFGTHPSQQK